MMKGIITEECQETLRQRIESLIKESKTVTYPISISQAEVLKLSNVIGDEANILSFSILFSFHGDDDLLYRIAEATHSQFHDLNLVILDQQNMSLPQEKMNIVQPVQHFDSVSAYEKWASDRAKLVFSIEKCCAEIVPVVVSNKKEGFFVRIHHVIADGWAVSEILITLSEKYQAALAGKQEPDRTVYPYSDFIESENDYLSGPHSKRDGQFWRQFLENRKNSHLLSDKTIGDFSSARMTKGLDAETTRRLRMVAADHGRTLQAVFFSAVALAYQKMEGVSEFCLGTILLNRKNAKEQKMLGNCFATVPIPVTILENDSFRDLNNRISEAFFSVMRRQRTSYSLLVSQAFDQPPARPLFDILINFQDYSKLEASSFSLTWSAPSRQLEALQIGFVFLNDLIDIHYDYRPDCISTHQLNVLHSLILAAIEEIISSDWDKKAAEFKQISDEDLKQLQAWNRTEHSYPENETLYSLFIKNAVLRKDQTALYCGSERLTYNEFEGRVRKLSSYLTELSVQPGQIVGVRIERSFDMLTALYAVNRCGAAYMPIGLDTPQNRLSFMLKDSGAPILLTHSGIPAEVPESVRRIDLDTLCLPDSLKEHPAYARPELPAYVIYTSGSTGEPKGVLISNRSIVNRIYWMNRMFGMDQEDVILQKTPYTFDVSVWELFWWSNYGASLAILPPEAHKDPEQIIQAVEQYHVTKMHFVPSMLSAFLNYVAVSGSAGRLSSLQQVFASGEALMPAQVALFYKLLPTAELINLYGPTECTVDVSYYRCPRCELECVPIGKPVDNTQLYVLNSKLELLPPGAMGELCIAGNLVGIGYLNRPELTASRFVDNPFGPGKLYRTGDLARWNTEGEIEYLGRIDHQVKLRGQRIELGEIEHRMTLIPGIQSAISMVQKQDNGDSVLVAYYTGTTEYSMENIREMLSGHLPEYMIPQLTMHLDEMPLSPNGKADRKRLPRIMPENLPAQDITDAPETELQKKLCKAFAHVLQYSEPQVGVNFNFFDNGGTSLLAIVLLTELMGDYRIELKDIYNHPTPKKLANYIEKGTSSAGPANEDYSGDLNYTHVEALHEANPGLKEGNSILITGATGFLGVHLLRDLLKRFDQAKICCLVRNPGKMESYWKEMFSGEDFRRDRIQCISGDITQPHLGMSLADYTACVQSVGAVYHCAADVRHFGQWETSYAVNTEGTRNVIHFCQENGAVLHHVSTMSVNGYILTSYAERFTDVFTENHLYVGQRYKENIYVHSKYLAEKAVIDARSQGLRANIYRVGNLLWRARDGQFQKNKEAHDFYMLTHAFLQLGAVSKKFMDLSFDMTAVDLCAEAIGTLSTGETGMIYHLMNPHQVTLIQYLNAVSEKELEPLPLDQLEKRIREQPQNTQLGFLLSYLLANKNNQLETFPREGFDFTVDALAQKGFRWDPPSVQFMKYVL